MKTAPAELPKDPAALRDMVTSLLDEKQTLVDEKQTLVDENQRLQRHADWLLEQLNIQFAKRFGRSSEKSDPAQLGLFDEAEEIDASAPEEESSEEETAPAAPKSKPKPKGRKPLPEWLPRKEIVHELPESERICALDGSVLTEIGRESTELLDIIPAKFQVIRHIHVKYGCSCCRRGVKSAPKANRPLPKALATAALLAHVAVSKYADGMPLYRQGAILVRAGFELSRTTLANWMIRAGILVQPLINLMRDQLLAYDVIQMDETTVQVLKEDGKPAHSNSYMWVQKGGPSEERIILFDYDASRSGSVPKALLADYRGYLQTDGYNGYLAVAADPGIVHVGCFAHARRKFDEAVKALGKRKKGKPGQAGRGLALIRKLYAIEKELRESKADAKTRFETRHARAGPILAELKEWMEETQPKVPPKSALGMALGYLAGQWTRLIRYLDDGRLEIDNNGVENAIRPFVIGRKGWLFSDSVRGVKSSANLYSLIETAKANGLEPFAYLRHLFTELPLAQTVDDFERLLPGKLDQAALSAD